MEPAGPAPMTIASKWVSLMCPLPFIFCLLKSVDPYNSLVRWDARRLRTYLLTRRIVDRSWLIALSSVQSFLNVADLVFCRFEFFPVV